MATTFGGKIKMTCKELIERLKEYPENTVVLIWDPNVERCETITGFLYDPAGSLELCSDDVS